MLDLSGPDPVILRPGSVGRPAIEAVLGRPVLARSAAPAGPGPLRSPGLLDRHYAPRARVALVDRVDIEAMRASLTASGLVVAVLALSGSPAEPTAGRRELPDNPDGYAHGLYDALHRLDESAEAIVIERPPATEAWDAVHDRLRRAATP